MTSCAASHARRRTRRLSTAALTAAVLGFSACSPSGGAPTPAPSSATSSDSPGASSTPTGPLTEKNLPRAGTLPEPIGGGRVVAYAKNARPRDRVSVCLQQPLDTLGATVIVDRSYQSRYAGDPPFPASALDRQPDSYAIALQFADAAATERAKSLIEGWVISCRAGVGLPDGVFLTDAGFDWTPVGRHVGQPPVANTAEAAEVAYRSRPGAGDAVFESIGLTVVGLRMMLTVHLFTTDESPYTTNIDDDEVGFAHPQIGLILASAKSLGR